MPEKPDTAPDWPSDWLRTALTPCVLALLADGPTYGYALTVRLAGAGLGQVKGGTLYPLLGRLEATGLVATTWREGEGGPGRKYYALTDAGREELARLRDGWGVFTGVVTGVLVGTRTSPLPTLDQEHSR